MWGLWNRPELDEIKQAIDRVADQDVSLIYVHGGYADQLVHAGLPDFRLVDGLVGAIPLLGDVFDVWFKAHRRNLRLLQSRSPRARSRDTVPGPRL